MKGRSKKTGSDLTHVLGPVATYESFDSLLRALCAVQGIVDHQTLAKLIGVDEIRARDWWTGSRAPSRSSSYDLMSYLQVESDLDLQLHWMELLTKARGRNKRLRGSALAVEEDTTGSTDESANLLEASLKQEAQLDPATENTVVEDGLRTLPSTASADRTSSQDHFPLWAVACLAIGAVACVIAAITWMQNVQLPGHDYGRECNQLAAAPWDPTRPPGIEGVAFENIKVERARVACNQASEDAPRNARYLFHLGRVHDSAEKYGEAQSFYQRSINTDRYYAAPLLNLGLLHDHGQLSGFTRNSQRPFKNPIMASEYYKKAADLGLPDARYCHAIALLFGYGGSVDKSEAIHQLYQARSALRSQSDSTLKSNVLGLIEDIASENSTTSRTNCEIRKGEIQTIKTIPK